MKLHRHKISNYASEQLYGLLLVITDVLTTVSGSSKNDLIVLWFSKILGIIISLIKFHCISSKLS